MQKLRLSPEAGFSINDWTVVVIFMVVIGGIGTLEGPIIGMLVYFALREVLADYGTWYLILLGVVAVVDHAARARRHLGPCGAEVQFAFVLGPAISDALSQRACYGSDAERLCPGASADAINGISDSPEPCGPRVALIGASRNNDKVRKSAVAVRNAGQCLVDFCERKHALFENTEIQCTGARHLGHGLALTG